MKNISKTYRIQGWNLILLPLIVLISGFEGRAQHITQEAAISQYGHMVHEMQTEAAAIVSDAVTGHAVRGHLDVAKSCPAAQGDLSQSVETQSDQLQGDLRIFVSFSMSDGALKSLAASIAKLKTGSLVMRGLHQNSFQKTAFKLKELGISVSIDPAAFERLHVTSVPQFVLYGTSACDTLRGNVSLDFALSQFAEKGDTVSVAKSLLLALRKTP